MFLLNQCCYSRGNDFNSAFKNLATESRFSGCWSGLFTFFIILIFSKDFYYEKTVFIFAYSVICFGVHLF